MTASDSPDADPATNTQRGPDGSSSSDGHSGTPATTPTGEPASRPADAFGYATWTQLRTPPQGAGFQPPSMSPFTPQLGHTGPLFRGALAAQKSPIRMRHLVGLCGWAASVTLLGLAVGLWVMIRLMSYGTPGWYEPVIVLTGLAGVGLAIAAFLNLDKGRLPWALMGGSTLALFLSIGITAVA